MTPASIYTLTMPSGALPSASSALSYISSTWSFQKGSSDYLTFAEDPLGSGGGTVVQVEYGKGSYSGTSNVSINPALLRLTCFESCLGTDDPGGGLGNLQLGVFGEGKNRAMVSYEVGFEQDFDFVQGIAQPLRSRQLLLLLTLSSPLPSWPGGKLPGSYGGDMNAYCTGGQPSAACFSLRLTWRANGAGEVYGYVPTYDGQCSSDASATDGCRLSWRRWMLIQITQPYTRFSSMVSFNRDSWTFKTGVYNTVTEIAILNSDPGTPCEANGVLAVYAGETLAFERTDIVFRTNASVLFTSLAFSTFFGGSSAAYAPTGDVHAYFRNFQFFEGDDASTETGSTVTATIPSASSTRK
ncbi:SPOSA6832_02109, partial [Sporobolomyces salmonicolor]